jgi:hypothetical protein
MPKGNNNIAKYGFKKGDPRINRKGRPKVIPALKTLMAELFGADKEGDLSKSEIAQIFDALKTTAKNKKSPMQVAAAKEIIERTFGKAKGEDGDEGDKDFDININIKR